MKVPWLKNARESRLQFLLGQEMRTLQIERSSLSTHLAGHPAVASLLGHVFWPGRKRATEPRPRAVFFRTRDGATAAFSRLSNLRSKTILGWNKDCGKEEVRNGGTRRALARKGFLLAWWPGMRGGAHFEAIGGFLTAKQEGTAQAMHAESLVHSAPHSHLSHRICPGTEFSCGRRHGLKKMHSAPFEADSLPFGRTREDRNRLCTCCFSCG